MADIKEKLRHLFRELVKDTSNKNRCRIQFEILKGYRLAKEARDISVLEAWADELFTKFSEYMGSYMTTATTSSKKDEKGEVEVVNVIRRPTLVTGDCFFSSIFRAANDAGLLQQLITCLFEKKPPKTELEFVKAFRHMLAKRVLKGKLPKALDERTGKEQDTYEVLEEAYEESVPGMKEKPGTRAKNIPAENKTIGTYLQILSAFPIWFQNKFRKGLPEKTTFLVEVAEGIDTMTNWVGTIEVEMTRYLLEKNCGIAIKTYFSTLHNADREDAEGRPILHLRNMGEAHWEYYSFDIKRTIKYPSNGSYVIGSKGGSRRYTRKKRLSSKHSE